MYVWWFSPHSGEMIFLDLMLVLIRVGEIHRRGDLIYYSRSPLSEPARVFLVVWIWFIRCRGDYTGEVEFLTTLVLPSMNRKSCFVEFVFAHFCAFYDLHFGVYAVVHFNHFWDLPFMTMGYLLWYK